MDYYGVGRYMHKHNLLEVELWKVNFKIAKAITVNRPISRSSFPQRIMFDRFTHYTEGSYFLTEEEAVEEYVRLFLEAEDAVTAIVEDYVKNGKDNLVALEEKIKADPHYKTMLE